MSVFQRPSLSSLVTRCVSDMRSRLGTSPAQVAFSNALGTVFAGVVFSVHGYLEWVARQSCPITADGAYLETWASVWGLRRKPATFPTGLAIVKGNVGAQIPSGTVFRAGPAEFETEGDAAIDQSKQATVTLVGRLAGTGSDLQEGAALSLAVPIAGVESTASAGAGGIAGAAEETDAALLARLLARIRQPPQGGAESDYVRWTLEVGGISRCWVTSEYVGIVGVAVVADGADEVGTPTEAKIAEAQRYLDIKKPVTASVKVFAPILVPVSIAIRVSPSTPAIRDSIKTALRKVFFSLAPGQTLYLTSVNSALMVSGVTSATLRSPTSDITPAKTEILTLGEITWD